MQRADNPSRRSRASSSGPSRARYEKAIPTQARRTKRSFSARGQNTTALSTHAPNTEMGPKLSSLQKVRDLSAQLFSNLDGNYGRSMIRSCKVFRFSKPDWKIRRRNLLPLKDKLGLPKRVSVPPKNGSMRSKNRFFLQKLATLSWLQRQRWFGMSSPPANRYENLPHKGSSLVPTAF